jgi:hypothetical protein
MTLAELRQAVIDSCGRTDKDDVIDRGLNLGLRKLGMLHPFSSFLIQDDIALATDELSVDLPTEAYKVWEVRLIDGTSSYPLTQKTKIWVTERWPNIEDDNPCKPDCFYVENGTIYLNTKSDGDYDLRVTYLKLAEDFADDNTENPIPGSDLALINWATSYVFRTLEQFDNAREWEAQFLREASDLIRSDKRNNILFAHSGFSAESSRPGPNPWEDPFVRRST